VGGLGPGPPLNPALVKTLLVFLLRAIAECFGHLSHGLGVGPNSWSITRFDYHAAVCLPDEV